MASKSNSFAILEMDAHRLACVRCRKSSKGIEVVEHASLAGDWGDPDSLGNALTAFAKENSLASGPLYTVVPRHDLTARILHMPSHDPEEVDSMLRLSAEEYVPFPLHDIVIDDSILEKLPDGHSRVLAVFAQRSVIDQHVRILAGAGLEPAEIFVSTACLASAVLGTKELHERWAFAHLSRTGLEVLVFHGRTLAFSRGIVSSHDWASMPPEEVLEELGVEIRASLSSYRRESEEGLPVEQVFLDSDWLHMGDAADTLTHSLGVDCSSLTISRQLGAKGLPGDPADGPSLAALGAALTAQGRGAVRISLVPESLLSRRRSHRTKRQAIAAVIVGLTVVAGLGALFAQMHYQRQGYIDALSAQVDRIRPQSQVLIEKQRQLLILQRALDRSGSAMEYLATMVDLAPPGISILSFTYREGEGVRVGGRGLNRATIDSYSDALRNSGSQVLPPLTTTRIESTRAQVENERDVMYYEIVVSFPDDSAEDPYT